MANTVEYYLSKGFDLSAAKYYAAGRRKIVSVEPNIDFSLTLVFDNGEKRILDIKPLLVEGSVFAPFRFWENFRRVYLDDQSCVAWDINPDIDSTRDWHNKVDLCPDSCYLDSVPAGDVA